MLGRCKAISDALQNSGASWPLPTCPAKIPALSSSPADFGAILPLQLQLLAGWRGREGGRRGANSTNLYFFCPLLQQVHDRWGVSRDVPPWEGVPELPAPKLSAAGHTAHEKLYESLGRERVVNYYVPPLLTSANKSNYHRLMNRAQAHTRSCR